MLLLGGVLYIYNERRALLGSPVGGLRLIWLTSNGNFSMTPDNYSCIKLGQAAVHRCLRFFGMIDELENRNRKKPQNT
jgi:hypothetical protein